MKEKKKKPFSYKESELGIKWKDERLELDLIIKKEGKNP